MCTWRAEVFYEDQSRLKVLHVQIKGKYDLLLHKRENTGGIYARDKFERAREMKQKFEQIQMKLTLMVNGLRSLDITEAARVSGACCIFTLKVQ